MSKFYDAKYIDIRDSKKKSGAQLSCGRTKQSENRRSAKNKRIFRGQKISNGKVTVRKQHYLFQPNDIVLWKGTMHIVKGTHCNGTRVLLETRKSVKLADLQIIKRQGGYVAPPTA